METRKFIILFASIILVVPFVFLLLGAQIRVAGDDKFEDTVLGKLIS